ncbi:hypothetical protein GGP80_000585 [Salinibacter ruber]|uniref:DUF547 domain-containing protein n=1 Tax=Salinibacter ruber TaxID=146919 RepID=UPI0017AF34BD|nr:DUF547 domain-containing protein [Salinibacter ruber]MBB4060085.1 hypothetical protein [Salinibacter ruber]MCS3934626.1 hypothetical protein [Salinibacter ruber]MCS4041750.1 hypothetical protein [Salinibacter ruber]MCS4199420.1 hypothetical protein [Salinibacter ruber]
MLAVLLCVGSSAPLAAAPPGAAPPGSDSTRYAALDRLLERFVDSQGDVDYAALQAQADTVLAPYLQTLAEARPSALDREARLAFWINAYNAYTLKLIVDHYPVASIRDIDGPPDGGTPFERPVGPVADTVRTLDEIEHEIIRVRFDEPRIHFALVCAAKSCPRLRREAYTGPQLDAQLDAQARRFLHASSKNRIPGGNGTIALSRILKWYGTDFGPTPTAVQRALAPYFDGAVRDSLAEGAYDVRYRPYDWTLNAPSLDRGDGDPDIAADS